jgi:hypothetical protein
VVGDIDAEVGEGVSEALHLLIVVVDAEIALNEALEGGVDVEGACFTGSVEVLLQGQPGITSRVVALSGDVLQVGGDGALDPWLDDVVHPVPSQNFDVRGVHQHVIRDRVTPKGEQEVVMPPGIVRGGEVQRDWDEKTDVLHVGGLDMDVGDDGSLIVIARWSITIGGVRGGVGEGGSIRAATTRASSARMAVMCFSSSRSMVVARTWAQAASYLFFTSSTVATMASSFFWNSMTLVAWRSLSVAIEGGGVAHQEAAWFTRDAREGERAAGP